MADAQPTEKPEELVASLAEAERLVALLEETLGLSVTIADVQGVRGPRGPAGPKGDPGPEGPVGAGNELQKRARGPLSAGSIVRLDGAEHVAPVSALVREDAFSPVGVVMYAVSAPGALVTLLVCGEHEDDTWNWAPGGVVFLGPGGLLTQAIDPAWAFVRALGVAVTATKVFIDPQPPVLQAVA